MSKTSDYPTRYREDDAPKVGLVTNATAVFNEEGKKYGERAILALFERLRSEGAIHPDSFVHGKRIFGYHETRRVSR